MKIARILTRLNLGGPARQVLASDKRLLDLGYRITVFAGEPETGEGDLRPALAASGVEVVTVPGLQRSLGWRQDRRAFRFLRKALIEGQPDLVHTHASKAGLLGRMAARPLGVPLVHTFHGHVLQGHYSALRTNLLARLERRMAARTDVIVAVSEGTKAELVQFGIASPEKIRVVYGASELQPLVGATRAQARLRGELGIGPRALVAGVLSRLAPIKDPLGALSVFAGALACLPAGTDFHLVFLGDGSMRPRLEQELESWAPEVRARVHLAGNWENMADVLPDLDFLLSASRHEGLPIAFVEGAACGIPAVATPVGGVQEFVRHGQTGLLGKTIEELVEGVCSLVLDSGLRSRLGLAARELALERHNAQALADRLDRLYRELTPDFIQDSNGGADKR